MEIGIIGVGKMGGTILNGIVSSKLYKKEDILLCVKKQEQQESLNSAGFTTTLSCEDVFKNCKIILLAIKPQNFGEALKSSANYNFKDKCVLSIAAGVGIKTIQGYFKNALVVRAMPNTPAQINKAVTTICSNNTIHPYFKECVNIFNSIGCCFEINEEQMDYTLPLNGSMPAYLYLFALSFIEESIKHGIDEKTAKNLTVQSIISSAQMILNSVEPIQTLIDNVCSKGGTTIAGLNKLKENNFENIIASCYNACAERSKELNKN